MVRLPGELKDRIDAARPSTVSREAWVREACELRLLASDPRRGVRVDNAAFVPPPFAATSKLVDEAGMCRVCAEHGPPRSRPCPSCHSQSD